MVVMVESPPDTPVAVIGSPSNSRVLQPLTATFPRLFYGHLAKLSMASTDCSDYSPGGGLACPERRLPRLRGLRATHQRCAPVGDGADRRSGSGSDRALSDVLVLFERAA